MKVLLTGFDPFGKEKINPALEAVTRVKDKIGDIDIIKLKVPTVFDVSIETVMNVIKEEKPDVCLCVGMAGGRSGITLEKVALNYEDARIKDNEGYQPVDKKIYEEGPDAYFTSLPIRKMVSVLKEKGIEAAISYSAGTFVCNQLFYGVSYQSNKHYPNMKVGFMHVPYIKEQGKKPCMELEMVVKALELCINVLEDQ